MSTFLPPRILLMRQEFYARADWKPEASAYVREHNLDLDAIFSHCGIFAVCLCQVFGHNSFPIFDFDAEGALAAVIEVYGEDGAAVIDLLAWPLHAPELFATAVGEADMLGIPNMRNLATYSGGRSLRVHRTPLAWLKAGCQGCVILNHDWGGYWLSKVPGPLLAEDLAHGRELRRMLGAAYDPKKLLVPAGMARAA